MRVAKMIHNVFRSVAEWIRSTSDVKFADKLYQNGDTSTHNWQNSFFVMGVPLIAIVFKMNVFTGFLRMFIRFIKLGTDIACNKMRSL